MAARHSFYDSVNELVCIILLYVFKIETLLFADKVEAGDILLQHQLLQINLPLHSFAQHLLYLFDLRILYRRQGLAILT